MATNSIGNTVYVNCGFEVSKRKLTENTKLLTNRLMMPFVRIKTTKIVN